MTTALNMLEEQIGELTDFDTSDLNADTKIVDVGLVSLDYVSIQIAAKKSFGIKLDLAELETIGMVTVGDFAQHIENVRSASMASH